MATRLQIVNLALLNIGETPSTSLTDDSKAADTVAAVWDLLVEEVLRTHAWKFATVRAQLAAQTAAPDWGYAYEYPLPGDCLRFLGINEDNEIDYRLEAGVDGTSVFTDEPTPINVKYIMYVDDEELWDSHFVNTVAWRLSQPLAIALAARPEIFKAAVQMYKDSLATAKAIDSQENPGQTLVSNVWIDARQ